jgi:hypothetical protein
MLTAFRVGSGGVERRSDAVGAATSQILVDSAESTLVEGAGSDQLAALGTRASVYAQYLSSRDAVAQIARLIHVNPALVTAHGPFSQGTGLQDYQQQGAESRATDLVTENKSYRLVFQAQEDVPIITVYATGPNADSALALAHASFTVLQSYITELKAKADKVEPEATTELATAPTEPLVNNIVVRELGRPEGGLVGGSANLALMVLAFVGVLGLGCLAFAVVSAFARQWRIADEMDRIDDHTESWGGSDNGHGVPSGVHQDAAEDWPVLDDDDGHPSRHGAGHSGPAVSGS